MTGREKMEAAFSGGGAGETPAVICYEGIYLRDHWDDLTACPWWYRFSPRIGHQLTWRREVFAELPQDWFALPGCPARGERDPSRVEERPGGVFLIDRRGRQRRLQRPAVSGWDPEGISRRLEPAALPQTNHDVDASIPPAPQLDAEQFVAEGRADLAARLLAEFGSQRFPIAHVSSPLWSCYGLWGFEGLMTLIADRPDLVGRACRRQLAWAIRSVRQAAALGAAGVWIEDCLTDLISPAAFQAQNLPPLREVIDEIRSLGMRSIYYYCGDPGGKWEQILSLGADALGLEESKKNFTIDIDEVVRRVGGRCTVLGNLDAVGLLQNGDDEQLRRGITRQIAAGRNNGRRFIMSLGSPVTPATPVERVRAYLDLTHELGGR